MDPSLGEGQSDYLACTTTGDPEMAPGFFTNGSVLRHCQNDKKWPEDIHQDPHETGLIFTGAMWDLRAALVKTYGEAEGVALADQLYLGAIRRSSNVPTTYVEVVAADDDDGDLANGTPNICAINAAFVAHGMSPYLTAGGLTIAHEPLAVVPVGSAPYSVRVSRKALFPQCGGDKLDSIQLQWGKSEPSNKITLEPDGEEYVGAIPAQADGTALRYRIVASAEGRKITLPDNPADDEYRVFVGNVTPIYCNDFETQIDGWVFSDENGNKGDFKWGVPEGLAEDPESAFSGTQVIGNDISINGTYASEKEAYAESPVIDITGNTKVRLQFRRWLAVEDGYFDQASVSVNGKKMWENEGTDEQYGMLHHIDKEWRFEDMDLSAIPATGGTTVKVRFELQSDPGYEAGGWTLDDFCIVAWNPAAVDPGQETTTSGGDPGDDVSDNQTHRTVIGGCGCGTAPTSSWGFAPLAALGLGLASRRLRARRRAG